MSWIELNLSVIAGIAVAIMSRSNETRKMESKTLMTIVQNFKLFGWYLTSASSACCEALSPTTVGSLDAMEDLVDILNGL